MKRYVVGGKKRVLKPKSLRDAQFRAALIGYLGMHPEGASRGERYAATTGELLQWVKEKRRRGK